MQCSYKGLSIHYEDLGQGRPVVLLHGYYCDHRLIAGAMEPVFRQREGYRRIYIDLPGMGQTPGADWIKTSDDMLDIVLGAIEAILPGQHFLLGGQSYGGLLARGVAHLMPERVDGLLLICPLTIAGAQLPPRVALAQDEALLAGMAAQEREDFAANNTRLTMDVYERYNQEIAPAVAIADDAFLSRIRRDGYFFSFDPEEKTFHQPTLMTLGRQDSVVGYSGAWSMLEHYPRATFAVLDGAGHNAHIEQAGMFQALANNWLDRVEAFAG